jgi:hypothetical protein
MKKTRNECHSRESSVCACASKDWRCRGRVTLARSPLRAHAACVPSLRQRQPFSRTLWLQQQKQVVSSPYVTTYSTSGHTCMTLSTRFSRRVESTAERITKNNVQRSKSAVIRERSNYDKTGFSVCRFGLADVRRQYVCVREKDWRSRARVIPARSSWRTHVARVPRLRQRQSCSRKLLSRQPKTVHPTQLLPVLCAAYNSQHWWAMVHK